MCSPSLLLICSMAQEGSEALVVSSSPTPNWWEIHTNPVSAWNSMNNNHRWQPQNSNSSNNCEDQEHMSISTNSFTNASNHSGLSMDSTSSANLDLDLDLSREPVEKNHLWSQLLFANIGNGVEGGGNLHNIHEHVDGENLLEVLSSKSLATEMFNVPACSNYLKKLDSSWELTTNQSNLNPLENYNNGTMIQPERLNNLSDLVSNWSIAPPNTTYPSLVPHYSTPNLSQIKDELPNSPSSCYLPSYMLDIKGESHHSSETSPLLRPLISNSSSMGYQPADLDNSAMGLNNRYLSDLMSSGSCLDKASAMEFRASKPSVKGSESSSSGSKKQGYETCSSRKGSRRGSGTTSEGKKKRCEDSSETLFKKCKHESSNVSSAKLQAPKMKLGDRITALQQIVSPFGKTDTASVLLEAINYIRFLQEQVQLLSDPCMKSSTDKEHNSWKGIERKDKAEAHNLDLRSRGLCLVPISCTPQVCQENAGPDYWTPTYRGCLYR